MIIYISNEIFSIQLLYFRTLERIRFLRYIFQTEFDSKENTIIIFNKNI